MKNRRELVMLIDAVAYTPGLVLRMRHIPGHKDSSGNIGADALATVAITRYVDKLNQDAWDLGYRGPGLVYTRSKYGGSKGPAIVSSGEMAAKIEKSKKKVELAKAKKPTEEEIKEEVRQVKKLYAIRKKKEEEEAAKKAPEAEPEVAHLPEEGQDLRQFLHQKRMDASNKRVQEKELKSRVRKIRLECEAMVSPKPKKRRTKSSPKPDPKPALDPNASSSDFIDDEEVMALAQ